MNETKDYEYREAGVLSIDGRSLDKTYEERTIPELVGFDVAGYTTYFNIIKDAQLISIPLRVAACKWFQTAIQEAKRVEEGYGGVGRCTFHVNLMCEIGCAGDQMIVLGGLKYESSERIEKLRKGIVIRLAETAKVLADPKPTISISIVVGRGCAGFGNVWVREDTQYSEEAHALLMEYGKTVDKMARDAIKSGKLHLFNYVGRGQTGNGIIHRVLPLVA